MAFIYPKDIDLWSQSAILVDFDTEQILFEKNSNIIVPPASMTKLVTIYMAYKYIEENNIDINSYVNISRNADWRSLPRDSSLMFIEKGQYVTFKELLIGLAIASGNDAAVAVAEIVSGSVSEFIYSMNKEMKELGFNNLKFVEPSGYDDNNQITVDEFVQFCIIFLKKYPNSISTLFNLTDFTYPKRDSGSSVIGPIKQFNRNPMIGLYPGCDGLKTGFINKSGMNVSLTATRNNRRVVSVITGIKDMDKKSAEFKRVVDSTKLLDFGLDQNNIYLDKIDLPQIPVFNGNKQFVKPYIPYKRAITKNILQEIKYHNLNIAAPIKIGDKLGEVSFKIYGKTHNFPIYSKEDIGIDSTIKFLLSK